MNYYFNKTVNGTFEEVIDKVTKGLKEEGFGILTDIDISATLKKKLDVTLKSIGYWVLVIRPMHIKHYKQKIKLEPCYPAML